MARVGTPDAPGDIATVDSSGNVSISEDQLRAGAAEMSLDYDTLNDEEREFVGTYVRAANTPDDGSYDPTNPLIPASPTTAPDATDTTTTDDAASPEGAETVGGPEATGQGSVRAGDEAPGSGVDGGGEIPPVVPAPSPIAAPPAVLVPDTIRIEGMGDVPVGMVRQALGLAGSLTADELEVIARLRDGQQVQSPITATTPTVPALPPVEDWDDPNAAAAYVALHNQFTELAQGQQLITQALMAEQERALATGLEHGADTFRDKFSLTDDDMIPLIAAVGDNNLLPAFATKFPGDPSSAVHAALEAVYWMDPNNRQRWLDGQVAAGQEASRTAEDKKNKQAAIVPTSGSTPRVAPPIPKTREGQLAGMATMIEADLNSNGAG